MATTAARSPGPTVPEAFQALLHDAAYLLGSGSESGRQRVPLAEAVRRHLEHRRSAHGRLTGALLVSDEELPALVGMPEPAGTEQLALGITLSRGAGGLEPVVRWAERKPALQLAGLEVALRDPGDLVGNARRVVAAVADLATEVPVQVEIPLADDALLFDDLPATWLAALDEIAAGELSLALRVAGDGPTLATPTLAAAIEAALDREVPMAGIGGVDGAAFDPDGPQGGRPGFLSILLAVRAALDGDDPVTLLTEPDAGRLATRAREVGLDALERARRWCTAVACRDVDGAARQVRSLGLLEDAGRHLAP